MLTLNSVTMFLEHLERNGNSRETIRAYDTDLRWGVSACAGCTTWEQTEVELARMLTHYRNTWAPKTTQRRLGTYRSWAKWAGAPINFLGNYKSPKPAPPQPHPIPEGIEGVKEMIRSTRNPRHRALCAMTGLLGLRVGEAVSIVPANFDLSAMTLTVRGKGDKTRIVPVSEFAWSHIKKAHALAVAEGTTVLRMSNGGARRAISRHARNAGLERPVSSHDMRATFATAAYRKSKNLRAVQELLGHSDAKTTQVYTGVSMDDMRDAAGVA